MQRFYLLLFSSLLLSHCEFNPMGESCKTRWKNQFERSCVTVLLVNGNEALDILLPECLLIYLRINECPPESKLNQEIGRPK
jgi:hypothetical protein